MLTIPKPVSPFTYTGSDGRQYVDRAWYLFLNALYSTLAGVGTTTLADIELLQVLDSASAAPFAELALKVDDIAVQVAMLPDQSAAVAHIQAALRDAQLQITMISEVTAMVAQLSATSLGIISGAGAPTNGVTGAGVATPGHIDYLDTMNSDRYINTGTLAAPTWKLWGRSA